MLLVPHRTQTLRVKNECQVWRKLWGRKAAFTVVEVCDLPAPKRPLLAKDRKSVMWRTFRQSGHPYSIKTCRSRFFSIPGRSTWASEVSPVLAPIISHLLRPPGCLHRSASGLAARHWHLPIAPDTLSPAATQGRSPGTPSVYRFCVVVSPLGLPLSNLVINLSSSAGISSGART